MLNQTFWGLWPSNLHFSKFFRRFWCTPKFENHDFMLLALLLCLKYNEKFKKKKPSRVDLGLILWIWSYSKENQEVKSGAEGLGMGFLFLNFIGSPSKGVWQTKMSRASLNVPTVLRPLLVCVACILRVQFFVEADATEFLRASTLDSSPITHSLWGLHISSVTKSRWAFSWF